MSDEPAYLLNALNAAIDDQDFAIGPSYLMTRRVAEPEGLERIWKTAILPLLAEHYFGEGRDIEREFGLTTLRKSLARDGAEAVASLADVVPTAPTPDE